MKFLLDMPVSQRTTRWLRGAGHDAVHARDLGLAQASDSQILQRALQENRIILTMDLDFPRLLSLETVEGPGVILIRMEHPRPDEIHRRLETLLNSISQDDLRRAVTVVEETRLRLHRLPLK